MVHRPRSSPLSLTSRAVRIRRDTSLASRRPHGRLSSLSCTPVPAFGLARVKALCRQTIRTRNQFCCQPLRVVGEAIMIRNIKANWLRLAKGWLTTEAAGPAQRPVRKLAIQPKPSLLMLSRPGVVNRKGLLAGVRYCVMHGRGPKPPYTVSRPSDQKGTHAAV